MKTDILSMTLDELTVLTVEAGFEKYRARQLMEWMCRGMSFDEMTNLSRNFRGWLSENTFYALPRIERKLISAVDGTVKYAFSLYDGQVIESVVMKYKHGNTICISSQAGCRMGCRFCASNTGGLRRSLLPSEMLGQLIAAQRDTGERISNIVLMGIGEPLDNYDNVIRFLRLAGSSDGLNISLRNISLSTCGLADRIRQLAEEELPITLSISLHAVNDAERDQIMPVNRRFPIDTLLSVCRDYFIKTGRRISFEYALIDGQNDTPEHAAALAALLHRYFGSSMPFHVNLIPINEVEGRGFRRSRFAEAFQQRLTALHVNATIRRRLGPDIHASCGQLRASLSPELSGESPT